MDPLQAGIIAARQGRRVEARDRLREAIQRDSDNESAWLWLSTVVETGAEYRTCLTRALGINPNNDTTRAKLAEVAAASGPAAPIVPDEQLVPLPETAPQAADGGPAETPPSEAPRAQSPPPPAEGAPPSVGGVAVPAVIVIGCLSLTALMGLLMLAGLLAVGWIS